MEVDIFELNAELEDEHWWFCGRRTIMRRLVQAALPASGSSAVIDIGCGTGANIAALFSSHHCIGIDQSEEAIRLARTRFPKVDFVCGSVPADLEQTKDKTRFFLLMDVLEHVPDDAAFLSQLVTMLRPGEYLLLTVPADMSLWSEHDVSHGHYTRYDMQSLKKIWNGLPVRPLLLSFFNARLYPVIKLIRNLGRMRKRTWGKAGTDLEVPSKWINLFLKKVMEGEAKILVELLAGKRSRGYRRGVSLVALLQKEDEKQELQIPHFSR